MNNSAGDSEQTVLDKAIRFFNGDLPPAPGQLLAKVSSPSQFPLSKAIRLYSEIHWRNLNNFMGQSGVAFDLPTQGGARATLYVVKCTTAGLGASPTFKPSNTGGCCVAAWQEDGLLYVLVVQGSQKSYREYLNLPGTVA